MKLKTIKTEQVEFMPSKLEEGVLYVSDRFQTAAHLCACGCGSKVRTPLGPTEWRIVETTTGPSMWPSIGNWQKPCKSHYVIKKGRIQWAGQWTAEQIEAGRRKEQVRRGAHYEEMQAKRGFWIRLRDRIWKLLGLD